MANRRCRTSSGMDTPVEEVEGGGGMLDWMEEDAECCSEWS